MLTTRRARRERRREHLARARVGTGMGVQVRDLVRSLAAADPTNGSPG